MPTTKRQFGDLGEKTAARYLERKNYKIIELNYQNRSGRRLGEIDIIAQDGDELVFVEVKTRSSEKYGNTLPEENITHFKLLRMDKIASMYMMKKKLLTVGYRFDAISVWLDPGKRTAKIKHISHL